MSDITPFTIIVEFLPALIITLAYVTLFGEKRNRFIEAFIALLFVKSISFFLFNIWNSIPIVRPDFDDAVLGNGLLAVIFTDFLFHIGYAIQEYFTWIMVSFMAVLFGQLVLMLKLALQDPLKMKFSNLIMRLVGKEPVSDGYDGLRDRMDNILFEGIEPQPLSPEVQQKAYSESWRDYLVIGLVTIIPSIPLYMNPANAYAYGIIVILTWIYRFGYPASNRIAKAAGLKLGDRDLGSEMMRGVLGWFFRLNLLLSIFTIALDFIPAFLSTNPYAIANQLTRYSTGLALAAPPILFAIILLPLFEDFSVVLYKRVFEAISKGRNKLSNFELVGFIKNLGSSMVVAGIVLGAFVSAVAAITLNYARSFGPINYVLPGD
ncbi:MAG: hypothetical protein P1Q69_08600, partial [Candidatus Thorarchaeota archaeon]|nr:hypothetical protein [Candidatus Thorarchaeota archaeon]